MCLLTKIIILTRHTNAVITQAKPNITIAFDAQFMSAHNRLNVCTKNGPKNIASEIKPIITNILAPPLLFMKLRNQLSVFIVYKLF